MSLRVLFTSGREVGYIRNHMLLRALRSSFDVDVFTPQMRTTVARTAGGIAKSALGRRYDVYVAGFYGQPIAIALAAMYKRPVILDAYVSTFETLCEDRRTIAPNSVLGRASAWLDRTSFRVAAGVMTDTRSNARYYHDVFGVPEDKLSTLYVGCDETLFYPNKVAMEGNGVDVFYYGAFLPLQGMDVIIHAATLLKDHPKIRFRIGGDGMCRPQIVQMIKDLSLDNIELLGWIPFAELPAQIARATLCLGGHFSAIPKASRVISTKTFQFLAMKKPTIVGINVATAELFDYDTHVIGVPMNDPKALADVILALADDSSRRSRVASAGFELFREKLSTPAIARSLTDVVTRTVCASRL